MSDYGEDLALVTGASGGIGADIARVLARRRVRLALCARNVEQLEALAKEISAEGAPKPLVLPLDLATPAGPATLHKTLAERNAQISILVNNAGFGLAGRASELPLVEQLEMIDLNIRSLVDLTLRFAPDLVANKGRLMNVASVAAYMPGPGMAVYYATKAFVLSFTEAMSEELKGSGVSVTALCPGLTPTGFQARAGLQTTWDRFAPTTSSLSVAEAGVKALFAGRRSVAPGLANAVFVRVAPLIPKTVLLPFLFKIQGRRRGGR